MYFEPLVKTTKDVYSKKHQWPQKLLHTMLKKESMDAYNHYNMPPLNLRHGYYGQKRVTDIKCYRSFQSMLHSQI